MTRDFMYRDVIIHLTVTKDMHFIYAVPLVVAEWYVKRLKKKKY